MKISSTVLGVFLSISSFAQYSDIYTKWAAYPDQNTQLIMDLSDASRIYVTVLRQLESNTYRIDSFGYKRACSMLTIALDSSQVHWMAQFDPFHPNITETSYVGDFFIQERNRNGTPVKLKLRDEIPEIGISFPIGDSLEFVRMVTRTSDEINKSFRTFYGGRIEETVYIGEHGGFGSSRNNLGMKFSSDKVSRMLSKSLHLKLMAEINSIRRKNSCDSLKNDKRLANLSSSEIDYWMEEMNKLHRLEANGLDADSNENILDSSIRNNQFSFVHYPFRCGKNLLVVSSNANFGYSKKDCLRFIRENQDEVINQIISSLIHKRGANQNIINPGYSTAGFDIKLLKGNIDDFYFDEYGRKIDLRRKKYPYFGLVIAQTFSLNENEK